MPLPLRGAAVRESGLALPPGRMPLLHRGRPLKRWRYVGVFGPELLLCAGDVRIGPARQVFWALWDRSSRRLHERTRLLRGRSSVRLAPGRLALDDGGVVADLRFEEGDGVEVVSGHGRGYVWTRKQGDVAVDGTLRVDGRERTFRARAVIDDTAGYHARHTAWSWSAGVGNAADGRALAWNLVSGIHDAPRDSERTLWVDGAPQEVGPVRFDDALRTIAFDDGAQLTFAAEAVRERDDNLLVVRSRYRQPFGTFAGTFPGGIELAEGYGVMERHEALW